MKAISMKTILTLALISMMLTVGTGAAFAASWSGTDSSKVTTSGSASWTGYVSGTPVASMGESVQWDNSFYNDYKSGTSYYPEIVVSYNNNLDNVVCYTALSYRAPAWTQTDWVDAALSGTNNVAVVHWYDYSAGGNGINTGIYTQSFRV